DGLAVADRVQAQDGELSASWRGYAGDHPHRGGLARAVGAQEPEGLALAQLEIDPVHRRELTEPLGQVLGANKNSRIGHEVTVPAGADVSERVFAPARDRGLTGRAAGAAVSRP